MAHNSGFDDDLNDLQIEDIGDFFPPESGDEWKGFQLGYMEEPARREQTQARQIGDANAYPSMNAGRRKNDNAGDSSLPTSPTLEAMLRGSSQTFRSPLNLPNLPSSFMTFSPTMLEAAKHSDSSLSNQDEPPQFTLEAKAASHDSTHAKQRTVVCQSIAPPNATSTTASAAPMKAPTLAPASAKRPFDAMESCSFDSCSTIAPTAEEDRGLRKKSREKMRRQEVNVKFDELVELLSLSSRVRKSNILQEAVTAIKTLRRERDEAVRERDRTRQEMANLTACLQYTHLNPFHPNAMAVNQGASTQTNSTDQLTPNQTMLPFSNAELPIQNAPGSSSFPLASNLSAPSATPVSTKSSIAIAPKVDRRSSKLMPATSSPGDQRME